jgi:hypothetical protein
MTGKNTFYKKTSNYRNIVLNPKQFEIEFLSKIEILIWIPRWKKNWLKSHSCKK